MRSLLVFLALLFVTPWYVGRFLWIELTGGSDPGARLGHLSVKRWGKICCWGGGVRVIAHGVERIEDPSPLVIVANHVSWFDVFALAAGLPRVAFIAKAELGRLRFFGRAMRTAGHLFVDRKNHKAAFAQYDEAAARIREGTTVVIFPEGTRGDEYALRPFKKGPFVLAIAAGVPIVPVLVHGSREALARGSLWVRSHDIHVHVLDPIPTAGCNYEDRNRLAQQARNAMAKAQQDLYGIPSPEWNPGTRAGETVG